jgi:hypothetical protein
LPPPGAAGSIGGRPLRDCKITGPGLRHLGRLTGLKELGLNGNPITDAGLGHLKDLSGLKELNLTGTKVSDDGVVELKKARPQTRILDAAGDAITLDKPAPLGPGPPPRT